MRRLIPATCLILVLAVASFVDAAEEPAINGEMRDEIQQAMKAYIERNTLDGKYIIYDAVKGEMKRLKFKDIHKGIDRKGEFYVSCVDFVDGAGNLYDVDLLVAPKDGSMQVFQALVHAINGKKREYHIEGGSR